MNFKIGEEKAYIDDCNSEPPVKIGHFSTDSKNEFCDDDHQMKYLSLPKKLNGLDWNLKKGSSESINKFIDKDPPHHKFLKWIICHKKDVKHLITEVDSFNGLPGIKHDALPSNKKTDLEETVPVPSKNLRSAAQKRELDDSSSQQPPKKFRKGIDFICYRSVLKKIYSTIYNEKTDWVLYATKFRSVIYLYMPETEKQKEETASYTKYHQKRIREGPKFEQYITSDEPNSEPTPSKPGNINEKFYAVMTRKIKNHGILFTGEIDAKDQNHPSADKEQSMTPFVEIKTKQISVKESTHSNRLKDWYLQCFITGYDYLVCGFMDDYGIVKKIEKYKVSELPKTAKGVWKPEVCLNFGCSFLNYVKKCVVKDNPEIVYKFYKASGKKVITGKELSADETKNAKLPFLPKWYIEEIRRL